jgi:hypothetical protein
VGGRTLTPRFTALASHSLLEACFCRPGERHDKGGVESRGKAIRQQVLVPIPVGPTLAAINAVLLAQMDARLDTMRDAAGQAIGARFTEEQRQCRAVPVAFEAAATTLATVTPRALIRLEGAAYSVWTRWAGSDLIVRIGPQHRYDRRPRRHAHSPSAETVRRTRHRLSALFARARAQAAGGAAGAARSPARSGRALLGGVGSLSHGAWSA